MFRTSGLVQVIVFANVIVAFRLRQLVVTNDSACWRTEVSYHSSGETQHGVAILYCYTEMTLNILSPPVQ